MKLLRVRFSNILRKGNIPLGNQLVKVKLPCLRLLLCHVLFLWLSIQLTNAQQPLKFTKFKSEEELQNEFVTCVYQDQSGFLWLGTPVGLHRFDGYGFKYFLPPKQDTANFKDGVIWRITGDQEGNLWLGMNSGLHIFNTKTEKFTRFRSDPNDPATISSNQIVDILIDKDETVWISSNNGLNHYFPETQEFKRYFYNEKNPKSTRCPIRTKNGKLWVSLQDSLLVFNDSSDTFREIRLPGNNKIANKIRVLFEDNSGKIWIGTETNGVFQFDPSQLTFTAHYNDTLNNDQRLTHNKITTFFQKNNELWIGTAGNGLNILDLSSGKVQQYPLSQNEDEIYSAEIRGIIEDDHGNIWFGSFYDGLYQYKANQRAILNYDESNGLMYRTIHDIKETKKGEILISSGLGALTVFDSKTQKPLDTFYHKKNSPSSFPKGIVRKIFVDENDTTWLAIEGFGIGQFDLNSKKLRKILPKKDEDIVHFD